VFLEHGREREHVVEVGAPLDDLRRRFGHDSQRPFVQGGQGIGQVQHLPLVVAVVVEELGGVDEILLNVVDRAGCHREGGDWESVLSHFLLVDPERFVVRHHIHVLEDVGQARQEQSLFVGRHPWLPAVPSP
jgi:hypothetical protein